MFCQMTCDLNANERKIDEDNEFDKAVEIRKLDITLDFLSGKFDTLDTEIFPEICANANFEILLKKVFAAHRLSLKSLRAPGDTGLVKAVTDLYSSCVFATFPLMEDAAIESIKIQKEDC